MGPWAGGGQMGGRAGGRTGGRANRRTGRRADGWLARLTECAAPKDPSQGPGLERPVLSVRNKPFVEKQKRRPRSRSFLSGFTASTGKLQRAQDRSRRDLPLGRSNFQNYTQNPPTKIPGSWSAGFFPAKGWFLTGYPGTPRGDPLGPLGPGGGQPLRRSSRRLCGRACGRDSVGRSEGQAVGRSGGQVGDQGIISGEGFEFEVKDTIKVQDVFLHKGVMRQGTLQKGEQVSTCVDEKKRKNTELNHSATHLMHAALREVLGDHVQQKGSLVDSERLRFDFSHPVAVTSEELVMIEKLVNQQIRSNHPVETSLTSIDEAKKLGAMMLFGEKYGDQVRVLSMSEFSVELCGGTHVKQTGEIGTFKIISEQGIASGVRRIEAITGDSAIEYTQKQGWLISQLASSLKTDRLSLSEKVEQLIHKTKEQDREIDKLKTKLSSNQGGDLLSNKVDIDGVSLLAVKLDDLDIKSLRNLNDQIKSKLDSGILVLASVIDGKISLITSVTKDLIPKYHAGNLMRELTQRLGGKGGGRPDMAQGGGSNIEALDESLEWVQSWVKSQN